MTTSDPRRAAAAAGLTGSATEGAVTEDGGETVGASDAEADAIRAGGQGDLSDATRDSDGVPVGSADADADVERSGADPDAS
ncbi:MAG: hypothetical protein QOE03_1916 [Micromonosporaceae bacterium]|jgi:hypothetical protein|nr:hypothetical protein [Micromonosporaceae bacterium]